MCMEKAKSSQSLIKVVVISMKYIGCVCILYLVGLVWFWR
ncbi:hypothetical protein SBF1_2970007 [Candidatus Desulfosporosinus infrequens]|uniref:Uncharacterized protein n=1 Tax=Candidatus Desulfosporosinus infrequens TaxID=2043169 RepID=A0A2U3KWA3_9FIRM|nr:hypothetical protein SBF1_2970007 [Candidatus Desulfosporosinus infrequens]